MKVVIFDIETKELIRKGSKIDKDYETLGVSVACAFNYETGEYSAYFDDNLHDLWDLLLGADLISGFNIVSFDACALMGAIYHNEAPHLTEGVDREGLYKVLEQQKESIRSRMYDLYYEVKTGAKADQYARGYNCSATLRATLGEEADKTGAGMDAPRLWQEKQYGKLTSYCLADVHRERSLFEYAWKHQTMRALGYKEGKEDIKLRSPQERLGLLAEDSRALPFQILGA